MLCPHSILEKPLTVVHLNQTDILETFADNVMLIFTLSQVNNHLLSTTRHLCIRGFVVVVVVVTKKDNVNYGGET